MPKTRARPPATARPRRRWPPAAAAAAVTCLAVGLGGCAAAHRAAPFPGDGCQALAYGQPILLDTEQAAMAATIAGVGYQRRVPVGAVTVAYAAALQESKLYNVDYGDRDSVGIFQQRPSQGWGTRQQLEDPVYAATRFFAALVRVPGYLKMPVYQAAQAVQRSADGSAYSQYEEIAGVLSRAFTGQAARAVWCWYAPYKAADAATLATASGQLGRTFGRVVADGATLTVASAPTSASGGGPIMSLPVSQPAAGWSIAAWLVANARTYGITHISFAGYQWRVSSGLHGWQRDRDAAADHVEVG